MMSLKCSCCRTAHPMPSCCEPIAQAHRDHLVALWNVVAMSIEVRHRPLGVRHRPLVHLRYVEVGDLDSLGQVSKKLALMELVSRMDFDLFPSSFPLDACGCLQGGSLRLKLGLRLRLGGDGGVGKRLVAEVGSLISFSAIFLCSERRCPTSDAKPPTSDARPCTSRLISSI